MEYITIREACMICNASEKRLREAIIAGEMPYIMRHDKAGRQGSWKPVKHISVADLEQWLTKNPPVKRRGPHGRAV